MLTICCNQCGEMYSLRGWIEKEDLRGTQFEEKMNRITDTELNAATPPMKRSWRCGNGLRKWTNLKRTLAVNIAGQKMLRGFNKCLLYFLYIPFKNKNYCAFTKKCYHLRR